MFSFCHTVIYPSLLCVNCVSFYIITILFIDHSAYFDLNCHSAYFDLNCHSAYFDLCITLTVTGCRSEHDTRA